MWRVTVSPDVRWEPLSKHTLLVPAKQQLCRLWPPGPCTRAFEKRKANGLLHPSGQRGLPAEQVHAVGPLSPGC